MSRITTPKMLRYLQARIDFAQERRQAGTVSSGCAGHLQAEVAAFGRALELLTPCAQPDLNAAATACVALELQAVDKHPEDPASVPRAIRSAFLAGAAWQRDRDQGAEA